MFAVATHTPMYIFSTLCLTSLLHSCTLVCCKQSHPQSMDCRLRFHSIRSYFLFQLAAVSQHYEARERELQYRLQGREQSTAELRELLTSQYHMGTR